MATIYRKTAKGIEEVQTRAYRLAPRGRSALILVDGQRSDEEIARMIAVQGAETLKMLVDGGFVETVAAAAPTPARPAPAAAPAAPAAPAAAAAAPTAAPAGADAARPVPPFDTVRREAVRRLLEQLGPEGEPLAMRMEKAKDIEALRPLVVVARDVIRNARGSQAATDYINALSAL